MFQLQTARIAKQNITMFEVLFTMFFLMLGNPKKINKLKRSRKGKPQGAEMSLSLAPLQAR
jgi:hypothetical protein